MVQPLKLNLSGNYTNDLPTISHNNRKMIKYIIVALDENGNENRMSVPLIIETNNDIPTLAFPYLYQSSYLLRLH